MKKLKSVFENCMAFLIFIGMLNLIIFVITLPFTVEHQRKIDERAFEEAPQEFCIKTYRDDPISHVPAKCQKYFLSENTDE